MEKAKNKAILTDSEGLRVTTARQDPDEEDEKSVMAASRAAYEAELAAEAEKNK